MNKRKLWSTVPEQWQMASELCAVGPAYWNVSEDALSLQINVDDLFLPVADYEEITPEEVSEVHACITRGDVIDWLRKKRGITA